MLLGVDVGGTFTDAVLAAGGRLYTAKAPTTPDDQSEGVLAAVRTALERAGASAEQIEEFAHGTTTATNALLEGNDARRPARGARPRGRARAHRAARPGGGSRLPVARLSASAARAGARGRAGRADGGRPRLAVARGRRHVQGVRARRDDRARRRPLPPARRLPAQPGVERRGRRPPDPGGDAVLR